MGALLNDIFCNLLFTYATQNFKTMNCLHIGCGLNAPDSWDNIDASPSLVLTTLPAIGLVLPKVAKLPNWPKNAKYGNIVKGLRQREECYDLAFAAHVLEHLTLSDFHLAVENIKSYLKPGGTLRVIVPDLEASTKAYLSLL